MADWRRSLALWILGIGLLLLVILLPLSIKRLESTQYGVAYDTVKKHVGSVEGEGLHVGPVGFKFIKFPAVFRTEQLNVTCISKDGLFIDAAISFQFVAQQKELKRLIAKYRDYGKYRTIIRSAVGASVHDGCALYMMEEFQSKRALIQSTQFDLAKKRLEPLSATMADLQLKNVDPPNDWSNAVQAKEKAREDIDLALNEREQALIIANTNLNVTRQVADITIANATTDATVTLLQANATAESLLLSLKTEADVLADIKAKLQLTIPGLLSYLATRALESQSGKLNLAITEPAKFSYKDDL